MSSIVIKYSINRALGNVFKLFHDRANTISHFYVNIDQLNGNLFMLYTNYFPIHIYLLFFKIYYIMYL